MADPVAREHSRASTRSTIATRTVDIYFQRCPQRPASGAAARGIQDLDWRVTSGGGVIANGRTGADGKVAVPLRGGRTSILQLLVGGRPVASYTIRERTAAAEAVSTLRGQQRRLGSMGYHLGAAGADGIMGRNSDRAILEFQGDESVDMTGVVSAANQTSLTTRSGY